MVDLEGYPIISNSEAIHIITGEGFRKLKRVGQGSVNGDLIQDAFLEVSFEFFQLLFGGVRVVDVHEVKPVLSRGRVSCYPKSSGRHHIDESLLKETSPHERDDRFL